MADGEAHTFEGLNLFLVADQEGIWRDKVRMCCFPHLNDMFHAMEQHPIISRSVFHGALWHNIELSAKKKRVFYGITEIIYF